MATVTSYNDTCFCTLDDDDNDSHDQPCSLLACGHGGHTACLQTLTTCPWCRAEIKLFIKPSVQKKYLQQFQPQPHVQVIPPAQPHVPVRPPIDVIAVQQQQLERRLRAAQQQRERRMRLKADARLQIQRAAQLADEARIKTIQWQMEQQRQQEAKRLKQREAARKYRAKKKMEEAARK